MRGMLTWVLNVLTCAELHIWYVSLNLFSHSAQYPLQWWAQRELAARLPFPGAPRARSPRRWSMWGSPTCLTIALSE